MSGEIEYLEEFKNLFCPEVRAEHKGNLTPAPPPHDEDSSSIDQDIFESLFEDNSDCENSQTNKKSSSKTSREERASLDSLDMLCKDLGEQLSDPSPKNNDAAKILPGSTAPSKSDIFLAKKPISSCSELPFQKLSTGGRQSLLKTKQTEGGSAKGQEISTKLCLKTKSVATVRPTLQQQQQQRSQKARLNSIVTSGLQTSGEGTTSSDGPSTSKATFSGNTYRGKQTTSTSNHGVSIGHACTPARPNRPQPTIFKPEKHQSKDPTEDPLRLDDLPNDLDYDSDDSYSLSDISGDSYVSLSDLDEDTRNIIDLSNDSLTNATDYEKVGASTPSPTVSDFIDSHCQHKPDFEDDLSLPSSLSIELFNNKSSYELDKSVTIVSNWKLKNNMNFHGKTKINSHQISKFIENETDGSYDKLIDVQNIDFLYTSSSNNATDAATVQPMASLTSSKVKDIKKGSNLEKNKEENQHEMQEVQHMQQNPQIINHISAVTEVIHQDTEHQHQECKIQKQKHDQESALNQIDRNIDNLVNDNTLELPYVYDIAMDEPIMEEIITTDDIGNEEDRTSQIIMESLEASKLKQNDLTKTSVDFIKSTNPVENPDNNVIEEGSQTKKLKELNLPNKQDELKTDISVFRPILKMNLEATATQNNKFPEATMDHNQSHCEKLASKKETSEIFQSKSSKKSTGSYSSTETLVQTKDGNCQFKESIENIAVNRLHDVTHPDKNNKEIPKKKSQEFGSSTFKISALDKGNIENLFNEKRISNYKNDTSLNESKNKKNDGRSTDRMDTNEKLKIFDKISVKTITYKDSIGKDNNTTRSDNENIQKSSNSFPIACDVVKESENSVLKKSNKNPKTFVTKDQGKFVENDLIGQPVKNTPKVTEIFLEKFADEQFVQMPKDEKNEIKKFFTKTDESKKETTFIQLEKVPKKGTYEGSDRNRDSNEISIDDFQDIASEDTNISKTQELPNLSSCNESKDKVISKQSSFKTAISKIAGCEDTYVNVLETSKELKIGPKEKLRKEKLAVNTKEKEDTHFIRKVTHENKALNESCAVKNYKSIEDELQTPETANINSNKKSELSSKFIEGEKLFGKSATTTHDNCIKDFDKSWETTKRLEDKLFAPEKDEHGFKNSCKELLNQKYTSQFKKRICNLDRKQKCKKEKEKGDYGNEISKRNNITTHEKISLDDINQSKNVMESIDGIQAKSLTDDEKQIDCTISLKNMSKRKRSIRWSAEISNVTDTKKKSKIALDNAVTKRLLRQRAAENGMDVDKAITETPSKSTSAEPLNDSQCTSEMEITKQETKEVQKGDNTQSKSLGSSLKRNLQISPNKSTTAIGKEQDETQITKKTKWNNLYNQPVKTNVNDITENDNNQKSKILLDTSRTRKKTTKIRSPTTTNINSIAATENVKDDKILAGDISGNSQNKNKKSKIKSIVSTKLSSASKLVHIDTNEKGNISSCIKAERKTLAKIPKLLGFEKTELNKSEASSTTISIEERNTQVISTKKKQIPKDERKEEPPNKFQRLERKDVPVESLKSKLGNVKLVMSPKHNPNVSEPMNKDIESAEGATGILRNRKHKDIYSEPIKRDLPIGKILQEDDNNQNIKVAENISTSFDDKSITALPCNEMIFSTSGNTLKTLNTSNIVAKHEPKKKTDLPTLKLFNESVSDLKKDQTQEALPIVKKSNEPISSNDDYYGIATASTRCQINLPKKGDRSKMQHDSTSADNTVKNKRGVSSSKKDSLVGPKKTISPQLSNPDTNETPPKTTGNVLTFAEWLRSQKSKELQRPLDSDSSTPSDMERALNEEERQNLLSPSMELSRNRKVKTAKAKKKTAKVSNDDSSKERLSHSIGEESTNESPTMRTNQKQKKSELDVLKDSMPSDMLQLVENHKDNIRVLKKRSILTPVSYTSTPVSTIITKTETIRSPVLTQKSYKVPDSGNNDLGNAFKVPSITPKITDVYPQSIRKQTNISYKLSSVGKVRKVGHRAGKTQHIKIKNLRIILDEDFVPNYFKKLREKPNKKNCKQEYSGLQKETLIEDKEHIKTKDKGKQKFEVITKNSQRDTNKQNSKKCGNFTEFTVRTSPQIIHTSIASQTHKRISQIKDYSAASTSPNVTTSQQVIETTNTGETISPSIRNVLEKKTPRSVETATSEALTAGVVIQNPIFQKNSDKASTGSSVEIEEGTTRLLSSVVGRAGGVLTIPLENRRPPPSVIGMKDSAKRPITTTAMSATNSHNIEIRDKTSVARVLCSDLITPKPSNGNICDIQQDKTEFSSALGTEISISTTEKVNDSISTLANNNCCNSSKGALDDVISDSAQMQVDLAILEPKLEIEYEERNSSNIAENPTSQDALSVLNVTQSEPSRALNASGLTPPSIDTNGTRLYSFLHPAKYNKNHCSVLLDYCCPNLDGPMAAIDPTRIHAQVQSVVRELPSYIVMKTELITRADLEANRGNIPASIRQKVEKITAGVATVGSSSMTIIGNTGVSASLSPTLTALQNKLPATTTLTPKVMPPIKVTKTASNLDATRKNSNAKGAPDPAPIPTTAAVGSPPPLTHFSSFIRPCVLGPTTISPTSMDSYQRNELRSSWRRLDALLKKHGQRILNTSYLERGRCIETIVNEHSPVLSATEVDTAERVLDLFVNRLKTYSGGTSTNTITGAVSSVVTQCVNKTVASGSTSAQHPNSAKVSSCLPADTNNPKSVKFVKGVNTITGHAAKSTSRASGRRNVPIYDSDQNIIGYQMQVVKSSPVTTACPSISVAQAEVQTQRRVQQNSPRIFYTKSQTSTNTSPAHSSPCSTVATPTTNTPSSLLNSSTCTVLRKNTSDATSRLGKGITIRQVPLKNFNTSTHSQHNEHEVLGKRTTRKTAAATTAATTTQIIVVDKNNGDGNAAQPEQQSISLSDECILPDDNNQSTQIKSEQIDEDFIGGN